MPDFMKGPNSLAVMKPEPSSSSASQTAEICSSEMASLGSSSILRIISSNSGNWMRPLPSSSIFVNILNQSFRCGCVLLAISALSILDRDRTASGSAFAMPARRLLSARPLFSSRSARVAAPCASLSALSRSCHVGPGSPMPDFMKGPNSLAVMKPEPSSSSASQTAASCSSEMAALGSASILRTISSISGNWMRPEPSSSIFANILNQSCMCGSAPTAISALSILDRSRTASAPAGAMPSKRLLSARPTFSSMSARAAAPAAALSAASFSCHVGPASPCPIFMNLPNMSDLRAPEFLTSRAAHTAVSVSSLMSFFFMPRPCSLDFPVLRTKSLNSSYVMRPEPSSSIFLKILNHSFCCLGSSFELSFCESVTTSSCSAGSMPGSPFFSRAPAAIAAFFLSPALGALVGPPRPAASSNAAL